MIRNTILAAFLFLLAATAGAQVPAKSGHYARGCVVDNANGHPIAWVEIYNESCRRGYFSDSTGSFAIPASPGDTLVFTTFGYLGKVVIVDSAFYRAKGTVQLLPQAYGIGEVEIMQFRDYYDFKKQFLALQLPNMQTRMLRYNLAEMSRKEGRAAADEQQARDAMSRSHYDFATATVPIYSRQERQMMHYKEVLKKEERQRVIDEKYNRGIIFKITRLPEDEITEFMGFCHFSEAYLYAATPGDIVLMIEQKFKEYKRMKEAGKSELIRDDLPEHALT